MSTSTPAPAASADLSTLSEPTSSVSLRLLTPAGAAQALSFFGVTWNAAPQPSDIETGLYGWVANGSGDDSDLQRGVLYWGVGGGLGGVTGRLSNESRWKREDAEHGHGIAMHRLNGEPVGGPVTVGAVDREWFDRIDLAERGPRRLDAFVDELHENPLRVVERFVIRLAIHLGDTGAPVQSAGAGAWANDSAADWAAFAVRQRFAGRWQE